MRVFALADLHLSFGVPDKSMERFGEAWMAHPQRVETAWRERVREEDLVLLPGDLSWGKTLEEALPDLEWIEALPGQKVLIRGNHDYWWTSLAKLGKLPFTSLHFLHNNAYLFETVAIAGTRLWDCEAYTVGPRLKPLEEKDHKIYQRELLRLEESLKQVDPSAKKRVVMTHYPPLGSDLAASEVSSLLEAYKVDVCLFGHLHGFTPGSLPFGSRGGVRYLLTSCDYLSCTPLEILEV